MRVVMQAMKIDMPIVTPSLGSLSRHWSNCSELCHITWPLSCSIAELRASAFADLSQAVDDLDAHIASMGWPVPQDASFAELRDRFAKGDATEDDVRAALSKAGIWAKVEYPDGREPHFIGEAIPPEQGSPQL